MFFRLSNISCCSNGFWLFKSKFHSASLGVLLSIKGRSFVRVSVFIVRCMSVGFWNQIMNFLRFSIRVESFLLWLLLSHIGGVRCSVFSLEDMNFLWAHTGIWITSLH